MPARPSLVTPLAVPALIALCYAAGAGVTVALRLPWDLGLPAWARATGLAMIAAGLGVLAWLLRYRDLRETIESSRATLTKLFRGAPVEERLGRTEDFTAEGPYRYHRHPMYAAASLVNVGMGLASGLLPVLVGGLLLYLWLALVMAPFEEREMAALFPEAYRAYMARTPGMLLAPSRGSRRP